MIEIWNKILQSSVEYTPKLVMALVMLLVGWQVVNILLRILRKITGKTIADESLRRYFNSAAAFALRVLMLMVVAGTAGLETSAFLTALGAAGLAIGLALQGSLSNIAGGVLILAFKPMKVGEFIEALGVSGFVTEIQMFHTFLRTGDNRIVILPNGTLANNVIINYTREGLRRVDISVVLAPTDNATTAMELIQREIPNIADAYSEPKPLVAVGKIVETGTAIIVQIWTHPDKYWDVLYEANNTIKSILTNNNMAQGIGFLPPQTSMEQY